MSDTPAPAPAAPPEAKQRLTASRMAAMQLCPRRHYWSYEAGLRRVEDASALRFGSAWHRAMEARWRGKDCADALALAVAPADDGNGIAADLYAVATLAGLLRAYYTLYPSYAPVASILPEVAFEQPIDGSRRFVSAGKIDGLCTLDSGHPALLEHKTTSDSLGDESDYWLRLRCNAQVLQYVDAARAAGYAVNTVLYDVTRKPSIKPLASVIDLDADGLKIVRDAATGERAYKKDGTPRQTGGDGYTVDAHAETPEEYAERLYADCMARPEFYFARKTVTVLDDELAEFRESRLAISRMILDRRRAQDTVTAPHRAWPRNVNQIVCAGCPFNGFCLAGATPDLACPPEGYHVVTDMHPELQESI